MKNALIVGASRGLGLSLAKTLLERGLGVLALYRDPSEGLSALRERAPERLRVAPADVRREADLERVAGSLPASQRFDLLIYNAAVHLERDRVDLEVADVDAVLETLDVNAVGAVRALKHLGRFVEPGGLIALISSEAGSISNNRRSSEYGYCMSKAALNMFTSLLTVREGQRGSNTRVLAMHPGWIRTDMGGPNADISADEAAHDVVATLLLRYESDGAPDSQAPYVDRFGKPMEW